MNSPKLFKFLVFWGVPGVVLTQLWGASNAGVANPGLKISNDDFLFLCIFPYTLKMNWY